MNRSLIGFFAASSLLCSLAVADEVKVVPGEYLIKFKASVGGAAVAHSKIQGKASLKGSFPGIGVYQISLKSTEEKVNIEALKADPDVEYIEPNYILTKNEVEPNAPVDLQSVNDVLASGTMDSSSAYYQSSAATGVEAAWALESSAQSTEKVIVAIVDTGLDKNHRVFRPYNGTTSGGTGALWVNKLEANGTPGVDDDQNGFVDDIHGYNFISNTGNFYDDDNHGTHVAGIVVGAGLNIFASNLDESKILIMPLKFLDGDGSGTTANAVRAIYYAIENGARIINNSWGGAGYSSALHDAVTHAYDNRVLVVSAAGNYSTNNDSKPMYPANYDVPSNIAIASTSSYDSLSGFSNYGVRTVHIGSPGEGINSTVPGNQFMRMWGTSMAAPFVSGMAALALREAPSLSGYQLKQLVIDQADYISNLQNDVSSSARINALKVIETAKTMSSVSSEQPFYSRAPAAEAGGAAGGCGLVSTAISGGPGSGGEPPMSGVLFGLLMLPLIVWQVLRMKAPENKRRHERFKMNSEIRVNVGDRELVGSVNTISEGGLSFNADAALEKGGIVTMRIQSPDGNEMIEVKGQVVWCEKDQSYGVQFANARQSTLAMIRDWTAGLMKT